MTTIAWRLAHLIVGFAETNGSHFGGPPAGVSTFAYAGTAREALRQLDHEHGRWIEGARSATSTCERANARQPAEPGAPPRRSAARRTAAATAQQATSSGGRPSTHLVGTTAPSQLV